MILGRLSSTSKEKTCKRHAHMELMQYECTYLGAFLALEANHSNSRINRQRFRTPVPRP